MIHRICALVHYLWLVITGQHPSLERMIFMADLTKTNVAIADLNAAADRLLAKAAADASALAPVQAELASVDDTVAQSLAPIIAKIDAVVPAPGT